MNNVDRQYLDLMRDILDNGVSKTTRSGEVLSVFGRFMQFDLREGLPLLTTKKVYTKGVIHELLWFLRGETNIKYLVDNDVNIWNDDAYRWFTTQWLKGAEERLLALKLYRKDEHVVTLMPERWANEEGCSSLAEFIKTMNKEKFLEMVKDEYSFTIPMSLSPFDFENKKYVFGDLGPVYGKQWRGFGQKETDQIQNIIDTLKTKPDDRRMVLTAWNPDVLDEIALPACHMFAIFWTRELSIQERFDYARRIVVDNKSVSLSEDDLDKLNIPTRALSCSFTMRSNDFCCGNPFNICQWGMLTEIIAHCCNMQADKLIYNGGDIHIYKNHIELAREQLKNDPYRYDTPSLWLNPNVRDINDFKYEDIKILNYSSYPPIKYPLNVG